MTIHLYPAYRHIIKFLVQDIVWVPLIDQLTYHH